MSDYKQLPLQFPPEIIEIPLSKKGKKNAGKYKAIIDAIDADLDNSNWYLLMGNKGFLYATRRTTPYDKNKGLLHRVILSRKLGRELMQGEVVDHINSNGLDNRRENLRVATYSQNAMNRKIRTNNTSGYKGVSWNKVAKKWSATIQVDNKTRFLGYHVTPELAYEAYCKAAKEIFGEYAKLD